MEAGKISTGDFFKGHPRQTALLVIDMQNAFLEKDSRLEIAKGREIIPNLARLIDFCRGIKIPLIWTQSDHSPPYGGLLLKKSPYLVQENILQKGSQSFELYPDMPQPKEGEYRVVKHKYDAFYQTDLELLLRNLNIRTVIITGVDTRVCCETTARSAFCRDFQVIFASDATACRFPEAERATLDAIAYSFGRVATVDEIITELGHVPEHG